MNFITILLLMFVSFMGLILHVFSISGIKFYIEFIFLLGLLFLGVIAILLIYNSADAGYVLASLISIAMLINLAAFYYVGRSSLVLFLSIISAISAFAISFVQIGAEQAVAHSEIAQKSSKEPKPAPKKRGRKKKKK